MTAQLELRWFDPVEGLRLQWATIPAEGCSLDHILAFWLGPEGGLEPGARSLLEHYGLEAIGINGKRAKPQALIRAVDRIDLMPPVSAQAMAVRRARASLYKTRRRSSSR